MWHKTQNTQIYLTKQNLLRTLFLQPTRQRVYALCHIGTIVPVNGITKIFVEVVLPNLKKNPLQNSVEAVPATSQKESAPKFCGGSFRYISKRIQPKILWRQFPPHLKKNPTQNFVGALANNVH